MQLEFNYERMTMTLAICAMARAIVAKIVTIQLINVKRKAVEIVNHSRLQALRDLNKVQSRKHVPDRKQLKLEDEREKKRTQILKPKTSCPSLKKAETERQQQCAAIRGTVE